MIDHTYVPGRGPLGAKLMILGDCPNDADTMAGQPFTGSVRKQVDMLAHDAGFSIDNCWLTNVSKFSIPPNTGKKKIPFHVRAKNHDVDLDVQLKELQEEVNAIKPNCILALSSAALWALSGKYQIGNYRGSILHGMGVKYVPTYHPRDLLSHQRNTEFIGYWNRQIMKLDFARAFKQSQFPEYSIPSRTIEICKNSAHFAEFLNKYKNHNRMSVDIEAGGSMLPICMGLAFNKHHAMVIPLWNVNHISTIPDSDMVQIWIMLQRVLWNKDIIGQNFNYDRDKIFRIGFRIRRVFSDIMLKSHAIHPELPKGLAHNTSIYTEEPFYKNEGMYAGSLQDLFKGCGKDACVTFELDDVFDDELNEMNQRKFYENFLMELPNLYWAIERQGFRIDTNERDRLLRKYIEWDERVRHELYQIAGTEINVNSPKQIRILLFENWGLPYKDSTGEEAITELLNSPTAVKKKEHRRGCELILEGRRVRKSISTYLMALPDYDNRMRTTYFPCLDTGRTSTGQQNEPIRPLVEVIDENGKKKEKPLGIAFQTMTKHGDIGADIRGMYVPDDSHFIFLNEYHEPAGIKIEENEIFVQADSSQAEARVVWLLANDEEALDLVDRIDYHALTASWFFGGTEETYSKKVLGYEHPIRFVGKTLRHAGHLGAGKRRASISVNTDARKFKIPIAITEAIAERALKIFHTKQPKIQQVFQNSVIECLKKTRQLIAPLPYGIDAPEGGKRTFFERWGEDLYRQGFSYIPQRAVSDNTKAAGIRIRKRIPLIKIVMESHDALLFSIPISKKLEWIPIIKQEMERPIDFSCCSIKRRALVIPCEIEVGFNYRDLSKFKDIPIIGRPPVMLDIKQPKLSGEDKVVLPSEKYDKRINDIYYHTVQKKFEVE